MRSFLVLGPIAFLATTSPALLAVEAPPAPPTPPAAQPTVAGTPLPPPKPVPGEALKAYLSDAFSPYEPLYFLADPDPLNAKFQLSFAVMLIGRTVDPEGTSERRSGLYFS